MNWIVFGLLCGMAVLLNVWIGKAKKCESELARGIVRLLCVGFYALVAQALFVVSTKELPAYFWLGCYYACIDWLVIVLLLYVEDYTDVFHSRRAVRIFFEALAVADTALLIANLYFKNVFTLTRVSYPSGFAVWSVSNRTYAFAYHMIVAGIMVAFSVQALAVQMTRVPAFYRGRYRTILICLLLVVVLNLVCTVFALPYDVSVFIYAVFGIRISHYSLFYTPVDLINSTLARVVAGVDDAIFCFDLWGKCVYMNKAAENYFPGEEKKRALAEIFVPRVEENREREEEPEEWEYRTRRSGEEFCYRMGYHRLSDEKSQYLGCFFTMHDRTEEVRRFNEEHYRVTHDGLTGLYNREYFFERVEKQLKEQPDESYYLICSNIKGFKLYNDLFGTECGDEMLKMEARLLQAGAKERTIYGRIAGDEFAIFLPKEMYRAEPFLAGLQKMREHFDSTQYKVHVYLGVYEIQDVSEPIALMCDKAKLAIESSKGDYNALVTFFTDELLAKSLYERQIVGEFDRALENKEFCMYLQPQISADGRMLGAEALVRWKHPTRGLVFPGDFVEVFEKTGLIYRLDRYVWELAAAKLREWKDNGREDWHISVNISPKDFYYMDIYREVTGLVEKYGISPEKLKLEITETVMMTEMKDRMGLLEQLRGYGFEVEIDDFGSGYSSLNMLKDIDVDSIKIDMGFLRETERSERSAAILRYIIALIRQLKMQVITEGVETKEQVDSLKEMGCDVFQGYYFAKPMPIEAFEEKYC